MNPKKVFFIFLLALMFIHGGYELGRSLFGPTQGLDFSQYYVASRLVLDGKASSIYDTGWSYQNTAMAYGIQGIKYAMPNAYPPFVAFFMLPFALLSYNNARYSFFFISLLCNILAVPLLFSNRSQERRRELILIGLFATLVFYPLYRSVNMGQINSLLFLFCVSALYFIRKNRAWPAGFLIAVSSLIKIFPLVLLPFFALKRQYRIIGTTLASMLILIGVSAIFIDINLYVTFLRDILPEMASAGGFYRSQGLLAFFLRLLTENQSAKSLGNYPGAANFLYVASSAIVMLSAILVTRRQKDAGTLRYDIEYGLFFVVILLILSKSWQHYAIFLLISYLYVFEFLVYQRYENPRKEFIMFLLLLSFCIWAFMLTSDSEYEKLRSFDSIFMNLLISSKFIATVLLFVCNIWILHKKRQEALPGQFYSKSSG
ncbi:MAG: DUF2029 domain-containing protein [Deferribacteres bacterium]|nr:DUF2029 domain-containing protein [Deferribacteres bacterium]